ncbi:protein phosphatase 1 regulatory subunit 37 [Megalops cyprinoides]|uniref:protein phosphatase 1 regulatory subunit 37 n=1 Tax=Megalops cyprinoides TaxID=118141 RepID=UPI001864C99C|nr:protein phosphatase 1 regulatory subunit 37 [Megalops cyprinoides]
MDLSERRPNKWWTETDTFAMLALIEELDLVHELDKKRQRNDSHFRRLRHSLAKRDIHFTVNQIRNRWKSLKHKYRKIKTAGYRSPAARLSAIESFRYFKKLDRMLARRPRAAGQGEAAAGSHNLVVLSTSDVEDHTDSDVPQSCTATRWQDTLPGPEGDSEESKGHPEEPADFRTPHWDIGTEEVVTLGLSGEYLYPVNSDPQLLSSLRSLEGARDPAGCSPRDSPGTCEDISSLILQQLTILNHQLGEQLAEQRAFHCSMLGLMDRQIEVLQQLSNSTRGPPAKEAPGERDASVSQQVHEALVRILRGVEHAQAQGLAPCPAKPAPSEPAPPPPSWTVSLLEVHQGSPPAAGEASPGNTSPQRQPPDEGQPDPPGAPLPEQLPPEPRRGVLLNGLSIRCQHK